MQEILVTGGAGFIGSHLIDHLLKNNNNFVTCLDNFSDFYDPNSKRENIIKHLNNANFTLVEEDIRNLDALREKLNRKYNVIVHLAAKSGVRPSLINPLEYQETNLIGTQNLLEFSKENGVRQFIFASSSSVYGENPNVPWKESETVLLPVSPYAASKVAAELLGHVYSHLYGIRFIALRLFSVYGPRQRPDLAIHKFFKSINNNKPVSFFGDGSTKRDYTYVLDVVQGICSAMEYDKSSYEIINLGSNHSIMLKDLLDRIQNLLHKKAVLNYFPEQAGDVSQTFADIKKAKKLLNYNPVTSLDMGLKDFYSWIQSSLPSE